MAKKEKPPVLPLYARDWIAGTLALSEEARGVFINLLCYEWLEGRIPADEDGIARAAGPTPRLIRRVWPQLGPKFSPAEDGLGGLRNGKVERVRDEVEAFRARQSEKGSKGGRPKKESQTKAEAKPEGKPNESQTKANGKAPGKPSSASASIPKGIDSPSYLPLVLEHGGGIPDRAGPIERILLDEPGDQRWIQVETGDEWNRIEDKLSNISAYRRERAHGR